MVRGLIALLAIVISIAFSCTGMDVTLKKKEETLIQWPTPPQRPRIRYIGSIEKVPNKRGWFKRIVETIFGREEPLARFVRPYGVFTDTNGIMYVTDPGAHLLYILNMEAGESLEIRDINGIKLLSPIGITGDRDYVYLTDSILKRLFVLDKMGGYVREIGGDDMFVRPAGVAVDGNRLYVVDTHRHQVLVFDKDKGNLLFTIGRNGTDKGEFNFPTNVFVGRDGFLYIMDTLNFRVQIFNKDGGFVSMFGKNGDGSGDFSKSKGIAVDSEGHIYVADAHFDCVQIFDRDGRLLLIFGKTGTGDGEMSLPAGIFIDESDRVYVADSYNRRVQVFQYSKEDI
ncbi:MAG: 6-bladed beta-propeller [Thermodesulfovibrionia bacterium]